LTRSILQSDRKAISGTGAQAEREAMLERQREGIAKAKRDGKYKGRVPTARRQAAEIARLKAEGVRLSEIALRLGIGRASVYWALGSRDVRVRGEDLCLYGSTEQ
jgi:DNA invertase Pin-like site-specific DNA recombinase